MAGNIESARDLGQGVYTQAEVDAKESGLQALSRGFKNYIINGGFDVWQRGTSFISAGQYTADRFRIDSSASNFTVTNNSDVAVDGETMNTYRVDVTGSVSYIYPRQNMETSNSLLGKVVTLSAWVKSNTSKVGLGFANINGTYEFQSLHSGGGEWEKLSKTFTVSSVTANATGTYVGINANAVAGEYFEIAQVQLEEGSVATPFEQRPYGLELSLCQRYYQKHYTAGVGVQNSATNALVYTSLPTTMRAVPTLSTNSGTWSNINLEHDDTYDITDAYVWYHSQAGDLDSMSSFVCSFVTSGSNTVGYSVLAACDRNDDFFIFDAEL